MAIKQRASFASDADDGEFSMVGDSMEFSVPRSPTPVCPKRRSVTQLMRRSGSSAKKWVQSRLSITSQASECGKDATVFLDFELKEETEQDADLFELIQFNPWDAEQRAKFDDEILYWYANEKPKSFRAKYDFHAQGKGKNNMFPLYRIIALGASLRTVEAVVAAYPPAVLYRHHVNKTAPLHAACMYPSFYQAGVIELFLDLDPESITETNKHAFLPIHNACCATIPTPIGLEAMQILVEAYPEALLKKNKLGQTPVEAAKENKDFVPDVLTYLEEMEQHQQQ